MGSRCKLCLFDPRGRNAYWNMHTRERPWGKIHSRPPLSANLKGICMHREQREPDEEEEERRKREQRHRNSDSDQSETIVTTTTTTSGPMMSFAACISRSILHLQCRAFGLP